MGKVKGLLEKDMIENPKLYKMYEDFDFWMKCREEEILERENKPPIKLIRKGKPCQKKNKK